MVDTLTYEYDLVNRLLRRELPIATIPPVVVRRYFAVPIPQFWPAILESTGYSVAPAALEQIVAAHFDERRQVSFPVHAGIREITQAARAAGLVVAVVSNNPAGDIEAILSHVDIDVSVVVGNDRPGLRSKPSPDMYLEAARRVGFSSSSCVAIEDSLLGAEAANRAGCPVIGVATGANTAAELSAAGYLWRVYDRFSELIAPGLVPAAAD
jgi:HAD superfamily hydrolase (TIGR01509 family)